MMTTLLTATTTAAYCAVLFMMTISVASAHVVVPDLVPGHHDAKQAIASRPRSMSTVVTGRLL